MTSILTTPLFKTTVSLLPPALLLKPKTPIACSLHSHHLPFHFLMVLSVPATMPPALGERVNSEERLGDKCFKHLSSFQVMFLFLRNQQGDLAH